MPMPQSEPPKNPANSAFEGDISVKEIIQSLWRTKIYLFVFVLIATGISTAFFVWKYISLQTNSVVEYLVVLDGVQNDRYPNGLAFNIEHLSLPVVFNETVNRLGLQQIDYEKYRNKLNISFYNPSMQALRRAYQNLLDKPEPNVQRIEEMQQRIEEAENSRTLIRLSMQSDQQIMTEQQAKEFLLMLVRTWSDYFISQGVLLGSEVEPIYPLNMIYGNREPYENYDYHLLISLKKHIDSTRASLQQLLRANKKQLYFANDLPIQRALKELNDLQLNYYDPAFSAITDIENHYASYMKQLLDIQTKSEQVESYNQALFDLKQLMQTANPQLSVANDAEQSAVENPLDDLLKLTDKLSFAASYTQLLQQKIEEQKALSLLRNSKELRESQLGAIQYSQVADEEAINSGRKSIDFFLSNYNILLDKVKSKVAEYNGYFTDAQAQSLYQDFNAPVILVERLNAAKMGVLVYSLGIIIAIVVWLIFALIMAIVYKNQIATVASKRNHTLA